MATDASPTHNDQLETSGLEMTVDVAEGGHEDSTPGLIMHLEIDTSLSLSVTLQVL